MPRAHRQFDQHPLWHITHRCHRKQFLLKFARDRATWRNWMFEARRRYGVSVLNYIVTCNHVHVLVYSRDSDTIARTMQLVSGRTAQQYNQRKSRRGAFWEDRYHAVPVQTRRHLVECMAYIDLNMVRAGVVSHPDLWRWSGFNEIQQPRQRYVVLDETRLVDIMGHADMASLRQVLRDNVDERIARNELSRDPRWTTPDFEQESLDNDFEVEFTS